MPSKVVAVRPSAGKVDTGIASADRKGIATALSQILADTYLLVVKTHIYHWNVVGPLFRSIHLMTEEQYNDLFKATDTIAERIRALGHTAPVSTDGFLEAGNIVIPARLPNAKTMVEDLIEDHESLAKSLRKAAEMAEEKDDFVTHDMLTARLTAHEKFIWMMRALDS